MTQLAYSLPGLVWVENSGTDSQSLLDGVADGTIDYTIADSTEFAIAHDAHPDLRIAFDFPGSQAVAWAASTRDPHFLRDMSEYFARLRGSGELAAIVQRYYGRTGGHGVRGRARLHAAFAEPSAAVQEMVRGGG